MAALTGSGEGAAQLARFNVSKDPLYSTRTRQKGVGLPSKHALPALALATLPVKPSSRELMHRPMCYFVPAASVQTQAKAVRIKLAGRRAPDNWLAMPPSSVCCGPNLRQNPKLWTLQITGTAVQAPAASRQEAPLHFAAWLALMP